MRYVKPALNTVGYVMVYLMKFKINFINKIELCTVL